MIRKLFLIGCISVFALSGCESTGPVRSDDTTVEDRSSSGGQTGAGTDGGASTSGLPGGGQFQGDPLDNPSSPLATRTIFFDYDSSEIKSDYQEAILAHGKYLAENPDKTVVLEGHTDERGSREYNIGLGERRAQSVRRLLLFQGAADKQIQVVSYGEEKPVAEGHEEMSYEQNRRVEMVYKR